jgi:hypothetical protein
MEQTQFDVSEVVRRLQAHVDSDPFRSDGPSSYWAAEEALDAQVPNVPLAAIAGYYQKVQSVWPEVGPRLQNRDANSLRGWAEAAKKLPKNLWNMVLLADWNNDPERLAQSYSELLRLYQAPANPAKADLPSQDCQLVEALLKALNPREELSSNYPTGWAAVLVREGSPEACAAVRKHIVDPVEDPLTNWDLEDLYRLANPATTPAAAELLEHVRLRLLERDEKLGQRVFFERLGVQQIPTSFSLTIEQPLKSGHNLTLLLSRDWRTSFVSWALNIGKSQASFLANHNGILSNRLKVEEVPTLHNFADWTPAILTKMKTQFKGPAKIEETEFDPPIAPAVQNWLDQIAGPPPAHKAKSASSKSSKTPGPS